MHAKKAPIHGFVCLLPFGNPRKYEKSKKKKKMMKKKGETLNL